ncbi:unnamed protein product [Linum tenue]|uniref:U1-type domain-containing protein n=1 Tax=Linum tenue TaxID=586396 RepID=A0AAV0HR49_9ROSI|nr:unnamed protein product [Linum tenue]
MVWFQCDDCGEELKKPKLSNHFRRCSASKLSCIDCGVTFSPDTVQGHTQCISEAEKYGPKGQGNPAINGATPKSKDSKQKPDVDINVGLSLRPPWYCSLCNTQATSKQALLLHADGKKHRAKARAFHAGRQPKQTEDVVQGIIPIDCTVTENGSGEKPTSDGANTDGKLEDGVLPSDKKRKLDVLDNNGDVCVKMGKGDSKAETPSDVVQVGSVNACETDGKSKKVKRNEMRTDRKLESLSPEEHTENKIKWKKLIKAALKSNPDGAMKLKKLEKHVKKLLQESGKGVDQDELGNILQQKVNSNSRFTIDGKNVRLVARV